MTSLKFGRDLELDLRAYELRRAGRPIKLERVPMEILILLVERRGDLVTREQIVERVWGTGVSIDTDNSINGAIRKIRRALREDPVNPRFIGTITGKGYRFLAPLAEVEPSPARVLPPAPAATATPEGTKEPAAGARTAWPLRALLVVAVLAGAVALYFAWSPSERSAPPRTDGRVMLAVLPFENLTGDAGQDYFSEGLTEEMITRLANLAPRRMGVIARTSVMRYRSKDVPLDRMGRELGVQYVLEGSVRRDADRLRITAQLIQVKDRTHLWAQEYDRHQSDILAVQAEISQAIAERIEATLGNLRPFPPAPPALSPKDYEAYDDYLMGRYYLSKRTREGFERAIASFEDAVSRNPADARAYAGMADAYALMGNYGFAPRAEVVSKARGAALQALKIDETLPAAHTSLALISEFYDRDWKQAEDEFQRALDLDMNYVTAHHWYAELLGFQGRFDEAVAQIESARALDPLSPIVAADEGAILYFARKYDLAIEQFRLALTMDPNMQRATLIYPAYVQQGKFTEALAGIHEWEKTDDTPWLWAFAVYVNGRAGRRAEAEQALEKFEASSRLWKVHPKKWLAVAYLGLDDRTKAMACLQQACETNPIALVSLKVDPIYDPLRDDPKFHDLLRCVNLAP